MRAKWMGYALSVCIGYSPVLWADKLADLIERAKQGDAIAQTDLGAKYEMVSNRSSTG